MQADLEQCSRASVRSAFPSRSCCTARLDLGGGRSAGRWAVCGKDVGRLSKGAHVDWAPDAKACAVGTARACSVPQDPKGFEKLRVDTGGEVVGGWKHFHIRNHSDAVEVGSIWVGELHTGEGDLPTPR